jgi:hypothetical protein
VGDILNVIAVILIASWVVGVFVLGLGIFIHWFLLAAIIALILRVILYRQTAKKNHLSITSIKNT